jgi:hypothetical protein
MKILLRLPCSGCGGTDPIEIRLDDDSPDWTCRSCGAANSGIFDLDFTIGYKILARSHYEHTVRHDHSMSIVFSATALECELSRLFLKWNRIQTLKSGRDPDDKVIEEMLRHHKNIRHKIDQVGRLLDKSGIDKFVHGSTTLRSAIANDFPSLNVGSLAEDFQKTLFWPRNRILHAGYTQDDEKESARCYSIAEVGLRVFRNMDHAKRKTL